MGRGPSRHHYSAPVTGLFTLTQPVILLHTVSLLWSLVLKVICYGSFPVTVRIALLFHFLKRPKKLGQVFHFLSLFCFPSISNILSPPPHSLPALLLVSHLQLVPDLCLHGRPVASLARLSRAVASCEGNMGRWPALHLRWALG